MNDDSIVDDFASLLHDTPIKVDDFASLLHNAPCRVDKDASPKKRVRHNLIERKRVDNMCRLFNEIRDVLDLPATMPKVDVLQRVIEHLHQTRGECNNP